MATTSPDNIPTPGPGIAYDLIAVLDAMAEAIQIALNKRDNTVARGTQSQRATAESAAPVGTIWVDTDGINMIWRKAGSFVPAVWGWSGTTAQMNAFAAPNGFIWQNTTTNSLHVRVGGNWVDQATRSGLGVVPQASWDTVQPPLYGRSAHVTLPVVLAPNETLLIGSGSIGSSGYDIVTLVGTTKNPTNTIAQVRALRFGNASTTAMTFTWTVIRTA